MEKNLGSNTTGSNYIISGLSSGTYNISISTANGNADSQSVIVTG